MVISETGKMRIPSMWLPKMIEHNGKVWMVHVVSSGLCNCLLASAGITAILAWHYADSNMHYVPCTSCDVNPSRILSKTLLSHHNEGEKFARVHSPLQHLFDCLLRSLPDHDIFAACCRPPCTMIILFCSGHGRLLYSRIEGHDHGVQHRKHASPDILLDVNEDGSCFVLCLTCMKPSGPIRRTRPCS